MATTPNFGWEVIDEHHSKVIIPLQAWQFEVDADLLVAGALNAWFDPYQAGANPDDALKVFANNTGASFGVQNTNAAGYSGIEYLDNAGTVRVFSGYSNASPHFRFNVLNGPLRFMIDGTTRLEISDSGTETSITGLAKIIQSGIGATSTDGLVLENATAASSGSQQWSPRLRFSGKGWRGSSQTVDFKCELIPVQGSASESNPHAYLAFKPQINGGGYSNFVTFHSSGSVGIGLADPEGTSPATADPPVRFGRLSIGPLTGHGHMGGSYPFPHGRAIVNIDDEYALGFDLESTNFVNKLVGTSSWLVLNPTEHAPTGAECYGGRHVTGVKAASTKNFYDIAGADGLAYHDGSGSVRYILGSSFESQLAFSGTVTSGMAGVHAKVRTLSTASGTVALAMGTWNELVFAGSNHFTNIRSSLNNITLGGSSTADTIVVLQAPTLSLTSTATQPYVDLLIGLAISDTSQFGAKVLAHENIRSSGANSINRFEGTNYVAHMVFGGDKLSSDTAPVLGSMQAQSAYPQATTNTAGGDFILAGGTGRRFFTSLLNSAGSVTVTVTVNGTAVNLASGTDFALGSDDTAPQLAVTATNLATAINANSTLNTKVLATASTDKVYLTKKGTCYSLTIATNQAARISTTSGADGGVRLQDVPVYANNAAAVAGGLAVGRLYRNNADPDLICIVH